MAIGQHAQDGHVIVAADVAEATLTQGGDRRGQGVVGIVLRRLARTEHPDPSRQCRGHVEHLLAGRHQFLGQQVAEPGRRLDGEASLRIGLGPAQQLLALVPGRADSHLGQLGLLAVDGHRRVGPLVRVHADRYQHQHCLLRVRRVDGRHGGHS